KKEQRQRQLHRLPQSRGSIASPDSTAARPAFSLRGRIGGSVRKLETSDNVILSEAKLQRSGRSSRGQAFNLGSIFEPILPEEKWIEMFESLASCFAFRCSASLNMTRFQCCRELPGQFCRLC